MVTGAVYSSRRLGIGTLRGHAEVEPPAGRFPVRVPDEPLDPFGPGLSRGGHHTTDGEALGATEPARLGSSTILTRPGDGNNCRATQLCEACRKTVTPSFTAVVLYGSLGAAGACLISGSTRASLSRQQMFGRYPGTSGDS